MKKDSTIKIVSLSVVVLIVLLFIKAILFPTGFGIGINVRTNYGGGSMSMGTGLGFGLSISLLLTYIIKFLSVILAIGLIGGVVVAVKNYIFTPKDIETFKAFFKGNKVTANKIICSECSKELNPDWKTCPYCCTSIESLE